MDNYQKRGEQEIAHGKMLAENDAELIWGWGTPAGKARANRRAEWIIQNAALAPGKRVLEIGCGTGIFTEFFAQSGAHILAVDISEDLLKIARSKNMPADRVEFLNKRFEECETDGGFDAIVGSSVLHHLDIDPALKRIHELLKPGGIMCFGEPNMLNPVHAFQYNFPGARPLMGCSPDEMAFTRWDIVRRLKAAGFTEASVFQRDWLFPLTPAALVKAVQSVELVLEKIPLVKEISGSLYLRAVA